jgi:hypothetical protein
MQTGIISFCGKNALNIKSDVVKHKMLGLLETQFNQKIVRRHYENFDREHSVSKIRNNPHLACLKSNGNPYFVLLTRINHVNTCVFIDKKIQHGYLLPRMIIVRLRFDDALFAGGTLLEGEMVVPSSKSECRFLVNDLIAYKGKHLINTNLVNRLNMLYSMLETEYDPAHNRFFRLEVKRYVSCEMLDDLVGKFAPELPYTNRGVIFKPMFMKFRDILHNFEDGLIKSTVRVKYGEANKFITPEDVTRTFKIKNTTEPDVYELYDESSNDYVGAPLVNTLGVSKFLGALFQNARACSSHTVRCKFNNRFKRWEPIVSSTERAPR